MSNKDFALLKTYPDAELIEPDDRIYEPLPAEHGTLINIGKFYKYIDDYNIKKLDPINNMETKDDFYERKGARAKKFQQVLKIAGDDKIENWIDSGGRIEYGDRVSCICGCDKLKCFNIIYHGSAPDKPLYVGNSCIKKSGLRRICVADNCTNCFLRSPNMRNSAKDMCPDCRATKCYDCYKPTAKQDSRAKHVICTACKEEIRKKTNHLTFDDKVKILNTRMENLNDEQKEIKRHMTDHTLCYSKEKSKANAAKRQ